MNQHHQGRQALFGIVAGAVALVILTALLTSAVASSNSEHKLNHAIGKLQDIAERQAQIQADQEAARHADAVRQQGTLAARGRLYRQNAELQRQLRALANFLRAHGFAVPQEITTPRTGHPKGPGRSHPATPGHTAPTPRSPSPSPTCLLIPEVCVPPISVPTLLP